MSEVIPFKRPTQPQDLVLRFLTSMGHKKDAEFYLKLFSSVRPESFAVIVLNEDVLKEEMDAVLFEIRYLMRLSLFPVLVFYCENRFLEENDVESFFKKAKMAYHILSHELPPDEMHELMRLRIQKKSLPLIHINPKAGLAKELVKLTHFLHTGKIVFLRRAGGIWCHKSKSLLSIINLNQGIEPLIHNNLLHQDDVHLLEFCKDIIELTTHKVFISLVSPNNLLRELFTVKGAGTLVQMGSRIRSFAGWDNVDPRSLKRLIETSFEKKLAETFFSEPMDHVYIEENYMGAALLKRHWDMVYLSKFAVGTEARGLGVGRDLWDEILKNHKKIFWRSDPANFITHWYIKQCDGMQKTRNWHVFWKGLDQTQIAAAVTYALEQKNDFA